MVATTEHFFLSVFAILILRSNTFNYNLVFTSFVVLGICYLCAHLVIIIYLGETYQIKDNPNKFILLRLLYHNQNKQNK